MGVFFFLQIRTKFIRDLYIDATFPFTERKRKIQDFEEPFILAYSEDEEPAFLDEWMQADESLDVLGQMSISMLATSLHLYLEESINELLGLYGAERLGRLGIGRPRENKAAFKLGWINGYRVFFREKLNIEWEKAPSNLELLEEVVLTRNRAQHPESIWTLSVQQSAQDAAKHPRSFFADDAEMNLFANGEQIEEEWVGPCRLNVTKERLFAAIDEVDRFCAWLEEELQLWPRQETKLGSEVSYSCGTEESDCDDA